MQRKTDELIKGTIADITYQNVETGFTVLELEDGDNALTAVGLMPDVSVGEVLELVGNFDFHSVYGRQFSVSSYVRTFPSDAAAILRYLSSGVIKGIGPATAKRIVSAFGNDTFDVLLNHPHKTASIKGITLEKAEEISNELSKRNSMRDTLRFFAGHGFATDETLKIFKVYQQQSIEIVSRNPYVICDSGIDISFARAETFAESLGFDKDFIGRLEAGVLYILRHNLLNGHTCLPARKLLATASDFLSISEKDLWDCIEKLCDMGQIVCTDVLGEPSVFLREYYEAEQYISARLSMARFPEESFTVGKDELESIEKKAGIKFDELQIKAINDMSSQGVFVLTGGPGTGKTTIINAMIEIFSNRGYKIALAAPTGRAAKRMTEVTGVEAKTLHRLLAVERCSDGSHRFTHNEKDPLDCDVIIIDEMSMVDSLLFESTLRALRLQCRIILVGDHNQLPSVGAGNVLQDIIYSDSYCCATLTRIFRQAMESNIVVTAHNIVSGKNVTLGQNGGDFFMVNVENPHNASKYIAELCTKRLPESYGVSLHNEIQVLCPSKMMTLGTGTLNNKLQALVNPSEKGKAEISFQGYVIRENDKVMQIKNNYDIDWVREDGEVGTGVFNGDIGIVTKIDKLARTITVKFDDRYATYVAEGIFQLELAYAVTVHKSQGSEFDYVVIPICDVPSKLMYRNLLYTAVTRAKKMLLIVGSESNINKMIENDRKTLRYTGLRSFIEEE
ncbi:MAG: ATP-dependent RecD-like DNA helicase [Clostridia bacterium]|nr:ATP-dependent RecD-like DNA helicase [Clostridia bacterium]